MELQVSTQNPSDFWPEIKLAWHFGGTCDNVDAIKPFHLMVVHLIREELC